MRACGLKLLVTTQGLDRLEGEDLDFDEVKEYQDDEEGFQVGLEEEQEAKELEAKNKLEFDRANKNVGVLQGSDSDSSDDLFGDKEDEKNKRKTKRLLAKRGGADDDDSSSDEYLDSVSMRGSPSVDLSLLRILSARHLRMNKTATMEAIPTVLPNQTEKVLQNQLHGPREVTPVVLPVPAELAVLVSPHPRAPTASPYDVPRVQISSVWVMVIRCWHSVRSVPVARVAAVPLVEVGVRKGRVGSRRVVLESGNRTTGSVIPRQPKARRVNRAQCHPRNTDRTLIMVLARRCLRRVLHTCHHPQATTAMNRCIDRLQDSPHRSTSDVERPRNPLPLNRLMNCRTLQMPYPSVLSRILSDPNLGHKRRRRCSSDRRSRKTR